MVLVGELSVVISRYINLITIVTRFSCLEAECICRQAAVKAAKILPLVGHARSKQDPINRGHGAQYLDRPPPAGAKHTHGRSKSHTVVNLLCVIEAKLKVGSSILVHMTQQETNWGFKGRKAAALLRRSPCQLVYASLPPFKR